MSQTFYMTIGLPGCGKSSYADKMLEVEVCSSDKLRAELYGDESIQKDPSIIFDAMRGCASRALNDGKSVYYDATNIQYKYRVETLKWFRKIYPDVNYIALVFAVPIEECIARDSKRERHVGADVILKMAKQFNVPSGHEGFDAVHIIRNYDGQNKLDEKFLSEMWGFDQQNSHHTLDLWWHCEQTAIAYSKKSNGLDFGKDYLTGLYHDVGKLYCKTFFNAKGEPSKEAHYYGHDCVSAYCYLCLPFSDIDRALIIENHMKPYFKMGEKGIKRVINRIGEENWQKVLLLHEADEAAH